MKRNIFLTLILLVQVVAVFEPGFAHAKKQNVQQAQKPMMKIGDDIVSVEAGNAFQQAQELINGKDFKGAVAVLKTLLETEPNLASVHYKYGFVLLQQEKYSEAAAEAKKCTELAPQFFGGWALLGEASMNLNLENDAKSAFQKALSIQSTGENADIIRERLQDLQDAQSQKAQDVVDEAENSKINEQNKIAMRINRAISHCNKASELLAQKNFEDGLNECRSALSLAPDEAQIKEGVVVFLNNYAADCVEKQKLTQAESLMKEAIAIQTKGGVTKQSQLTTLKNYGALLAFLGRTAESNAIKSQMEKLQK